MEFVYIYDEMPKDLTENGEPLIDWSDHPEITRIINSTFSFYGAYRIKGQNRKSIKKRKFIKAFWEDGTWQYFKIKTVKKNLKTVSFTATHIGYEANRNFIQLSYTNRGDGKQIMKNLKENQAFKQPFMFESDVSSSHQFTAKEVNTIDAIIGQNNGNQNLAGVTGGELDMDNYTLTLKERIGEDNGYRIDLGVNLEAIEEYVDDNAVINSLHLIGGVPEDTDYDIDQEPITFSYLEVKGTTDENKQIGKRENADCKTVEELKEWGQTLFDNDRIHEPKATHEVNMIMLENTVEYQDLYKDIASLHFGDTAYCELKDWDFGVQERMIECVWIPTLKKFKSVVLGNDMGMYTDAVESSANEMKQKLETRSNELQNAIINATNWITGTKGGYVRFRPKNAPEEILIMDRPKASEAKKVWRWNLGGLGYSNNGIDGPFETAITQNGEIVANFIKVGIINAKVFMTSFNKLGEALILTEAALQVVNKDGKRIMELNRNGMEFFKGSEKLARIGTKGSMFPWIAENEVTERGIFLELDVKGEYIKISGNKENGILIYKDGSVHINGDNSKDGIVLWGDVALANGNLKVSGDISSKNWGTGGGNNGSGGNIGSREDYAKNMITAEFNVDYDKMYASWVNFPRIRAWGINNRATFNELNQIIKNNGVSPVFFWAYEGGEGYNASLSFLNHFYTNGSSYKEEARRTAQWVKETSNTNGNLAWYDAQYPYYTSPSDKQAKGNAYMATTKNGMIARVMLQGTAAATWAMFDPAALKGSVNGKQDYGDPFAHQMSLIKKWQRKNANGYGYPVLAGTPITSWFGPRWGTMHNGIDFAGAIGDPIFAAQSGTVWLSSFDNDMGEWVIIKHDTDSYMTGYAHNSQRLVSVGQKVSKGQQIARMGSTGDSTGPHCHFAVQTEKWSGYVDPAPFLGLTPPR